MDNQVLMDKAIAAMDFAYAPYSGCKVGAALLCNDDSIYTGCNIENAAFGPTNCAERTAVFKAVSEGKRDFVKIAICGGKDGIVTDSFFPCGVCRQVLLEFCRQDFEIIVLNSEGMEVYTLGELLPKSFGADKLR